MGVEPDSVEVPYDDAVPTPHRLLDAAVPVIEQLVSQLTDTSATILLANSEAHIVQRWACRSFLPTLDRYNVAPGFSFAEHGVGTNGIGCAAEEKRLFEVRGPEHFRECLQSLVCVAAPIVLPTTNVAQGVLNVTCSVDEATHLLRPLLQHAVADIERRLLEASSLRERTILDAYLTRSRRTPHGVIAVSSDLVMANAAAEALVPPADRFVLWQWALDALSTRSEASRVFASEQSGDLTITASAIGDQRPPSAALLEVRSVAADGARPARRVIDHDPLSSVIIGRSRASNQLRRAVRSAIVDQPHVVVVGPDGAGRNFVARAVAGGGRPDGATPVVRSAAELETIDGGSVVARSVGRWPIDQVEELLAVADARSLRVVATADESADAAPAVRCFGHRVEVPSLERRIDDLPLLTATLMAELCEGRRREVRPDAMAALLHHSWPGNVSELRSVLAVALAAAGDMDLSVFHLPDSFRQRNVTDRWTAIELAEREAIMRALHEHEGNKVAAAAALGLARSTLYRKMRTFQIDVA
ncbi:MAG: helix-turn-helix domain-containing protein [Acidimicrobiales bacterium]